MYQVYIKYLCWISRIEHLKTFPRLLIMIYVSCKIVERPISISWLGEYITSFSAYYEC